MKSVLRKKSLCFIVHRQVPVAYVFTIRTYNCEMWSVSAQLAKKLNRFKKRSFRKVQRISWTQILSNEKVAKIFNFQRYILKQISLQQLQFLSHEMRKHELENLSLTDKIDDSRARGRQGEIFMSRFQRNANHLIQMTQDR